MADRTRTNRALAALVAAIRDDTGATPWHEQGVTAVLTGLTDRPILDVALAAVIAAATRPDQHAPTVIALDGQHWTRAAAALAPPGEQPAQRNPSVERCPHGGYSLACGQCRTRAAHTAASGAALARQALRTRHEDQSHD